MNTIDKQYQALLQDILDNGYTKKDRTGTGTISVFGRQIRHRMSEGFPLITTKKMAFKTMVTELLWFLRGDTNIKYLVDNGCHIWDGDAYKRYKTQIIEMIESWDAKYDQILKTEANGCKPYTMEEFIERIKTDSEFAAKWGNLGPIYGKQWRAWDRFIYDPYQRENNATFRVEEVQTIDQIADAIHKLKTNPDDRGIIVSAWHVGELDQMVLRPCHNFFQLYTRELSLDERRDIAKKQLHPEKYYELGLVSPFTDKLIQYWLDEHKIPKRAISLMYNARSQDVPLGTPFNIASYALLLEIIGKMVNMIPDELIANMGDCHIYLNQIDGVKEQIIREPYELPNLVISNQVNFSEGINEFINSCSITDFKIEEYQSHPTIRMPLSN